ncbi:MAG: hypothetical protein ACAH17_03950 [Candidatus Paceibacterota bacterium]
MDKDERTTLMLHLYDKRKKPPFGGLLRGQVGSPAVFEAQVATEAGEKDDATPGREQPCFPCDVEEVVDSALEVVFPCRFFLDVFSRHRRHDLSAKHPDGDHG